MKICNCQKQPLEILCKRGVYKSFANFTGKHLCRSLILIKLQFWGLTALLKKTPTQTFSCEVCEIFENNHFEEHLWATTSKLYLKRDSNTGAFLWTLWVIQERPFCRASTNGWFLNTSGVGGGVGEGRGASLSLSLIKFQAWPPEGL